MSLPVEYRASLSEINSLMNFNEKVRRLWANRYPSWWGRMLSGIAVIQGPVDSSEVLYVSTLMEDERFKVAIFTSRFVFIGQTTEPDVDAADFTLTAHRFDRINNISVNASASTFGTSMHPSWPGQLTVTIDHASFGSMTLPLDPERSSHSDDALEKFVPILVGKMS